jgi:hypothetical protein
MKVKNKILFKVMSLAGNTLRTPPQEYNISNCCRNFPKDFNKLKSGREELI